METQAEAYWPLEMFGLHKGTLKDKAERHAVFAQPERAWLADALEERRTAYTLEEIRAMDVIVFTSSDLATVENPRDYEPLQVHAAERAEKKDDELARQVVKARRVDELVAALGEELARWAERTGGKLPSADEAEQFISMKGADLLRERGVDEDALRQLTDLFISEREGLVRAVRETARRAEVDG